MTRSEAPAAGGRLHPATLAFRILGHVRALLVPALLVLVFARGDRWQLWLGVLFVPTVLYDVFQYFTMRWRYEREDLVIQQGLIFRQVRHLPYARVQNVDLKQGPLHRLARVAEVRIETAGGGAADAVLRVIGLDQYEELRARIFAGRAAAQSVVAGQPPPVPVRTEPLLHLGGADLLVLALNPGRGLALIALAWGFAWEFDLFDRIHFGDRVEAWLAAAGGSAALVSIAAAVAGLALVIYLLSAVAALLAFWDFRLEQEGEIFRIRRGLFTRQVASIPRRRIQVLTIKRSWPHRLLGRARVLVGTAGGDVTETQGQEGGAHFAPIIRERDLPALLARIRPGLDLDGQEWRPLGRRAGWRMLLAPLALRALLLAGLSWAFGVIGAAIGIAMLLVTLLLARVRWRVSRWARPAWGFVWRSGGLGYSVSTTFDDKLQAVMLEQSPLDRRHRHATLRLDTAAGVKTGHALTVPFLPLAQAQALRAELTAAAAATHFRW
jgi:putative membrane protein